MQFQHLTSLKHIFKLDPNKPITESEIKQLCESKTDAIMVGGTLGITYEDTARLLSELRKYDKILIQEVSDIQSIVPGFHYYYIPVVLNAQDPNWIFNMHHQALKKYGDLIQWEQVIVEGYVVLNPESSVAKLTNCKIDMTQEDVVAYARMCDQMLRLPVLYIEYSGMYGNMEWLKEIRAVVQASRVFYGGGIHSRERAIESSQFADTIVIGNLIYEDFNRALKTIPPLKD